METPLSNHVIMYLDSVYANRKYNDPSGLPMSLLVSHHTLESSIRPFHLSVGDLMLCYQTLGVSFLSTRIKEICDFMSMIRLNRYTPDSSI